MAPCVGTSIFINFDFFSISYNRRYRHYEHSDFNWDNKYTLSSVSEKQKLALEVLKASHKMFKPHEKRNCHCSHVARLKKQLEAGKKVEEIDQVVKQKGNDFRTKKDFTNEDRSSRREIEQQPDRAQGIRGGLGSYKIHCGISRELNNLNSQQLDPDEQSLLSQFTRSNGTHEDEPLPKRKRLEVNEEKETSKRRRSNRN
ncbi:hypothetical protein L3Y34_011371 [Caenorhabditis briggsae]|uniref:Uncharacterized protein n=1 Tax=Caenorhabditis briggsae TaxID=6238 RepID=A0AAE8ZNR5_CAEBR|nr:hypothetical protein L3Y34_011371 [Caenorhabditis briggsae]